MLRVLANCCVWKLQRSQNTRAVNNLGLRMFRFPRFKLVFVHIKYTSNVAACYDNDVNDVTEPHLLQYFRCMALLN